MDDKVFDEMRAWMQSAGLRAQRTRGRTCAGATCSAVCKCVPPGRTATPSSAASATPSERPTATAPSALDPSSYLSLKAKLKPLRLAVIVFYIFSIRSTNSRIKLYQYAV